LYVATHLLPEGVDSVVAAGEALARQPKGTTQDLNANSLQPPKDESEKKQCIVVIAPERVMRVRK